MTAVKLPSEIVENIINFHRMYILHQQFKYSIFEINFFCVCNYAFVSRYLHIIM